MATIDSDYIKQTATQLATYEVQAALAKANRNEAAYKARLSAVTALDGALKAFKSTLGGLKSGAGSMLVNSASFSQAGYATATVDTTAIAGSYQFFVEQLASRHQLAVAGLQDGDVDSSGSLTIGLGAGNFTIDLSSIDSDGDGSNSLAELASAINGAAGNAGVNATLVRSNGQVSLVFASEESGAANTISLSTSGTSGGVFDAALGSVTELSPARDAKVRLGGEGGMLLTNASNTFENIIDGLNLTFSKVHLAGEQPLTVDIAQDKSATKEKAQSFISAFNTLMSSFDTLGASGGQGSTRGVLAGDASIRSIESMLNKVVRTEYGGVSLMEFGIVADRNGKLSIDGVRFEKAVAANPEGFEKLFVDKGNLLDSLDKNLAVYTSSANGLMKARKDNLNAKLQGLDEQFDGIQKQYDSYYNRYLKQYTSMMQTMATMNQTAGLFG